MPVLNLISWLVDVPTPFASLGILKRLAELAAVLFGFKVVDQAVQQFKNAVAIAAHGNKAQTLIKVRKSEAEEFL